MDNHDKIARLAQLPPETLAKELLRVATEADALSRAERLHFNYLPDDATKALEDNLPHLTRNEALSHVADEPGLTHRLIIGDNVHALMGLQLEEGTYDLAYSDPPYNTGSQDFIYNDRFVPSDDSWTHSKWLSFMEPRLKLERNLLKDTGIKIIAIGNRELANMKTLMDSIYGEENFIDIIVWEGGRKNDSRFVSNGCDYMLIYAKNKSVLLEQDIKWREEKSGVHEVIAAGVKAWEDSGHDAEEATKLLKKWWRGIPADHPAKKDKGLSLYGFIHSNGRVYRQGDMSFPGGGGYDYDIVHPVTGKPVRRTSRGWRTPPTRMEEWIKEDRVVFGKDETTIPQYRRYLDEMLTSVPTSVFFADRSASNKYLVPILGKSVFDFPKDHTVLARWFNIVAGKDAKVIDCFAGSGSTMEAVLSLNAQDGGTRACTLVTNDENGIGSNITRERCVRVMTGEGWADGKEHEGLGGHLAVFNVDVLTSEVPLRYLLDSRVSELTRNAWTEQSHAQVACAHDTPWLVKNVNGFAVYTDDLVAPGKHVIIGYSVLESDQDDLEDLRAEYPEAVTIGIQSGQSSKFLYLEGVDHVMPAPQIGIFKRCSNFNNTNHYGNFVQTVESLMPAVTETFNEDEN